MELHTKLETVGQDEDKYNNGPWNVFVSVGHKVKYYLNLEETEPSLCDNLIPRLTITDLIKILRAGGAASSHLITADNTAYTIELGTILREDWSITIMEKAPARAKLQT